MSPSFRHPGMPATLVALLSAILGATALLCASPSTAAPTAPSAKRAVVTIQDFSFHPGVLTVASGATIVWINKDDDVHTIKSEDGPERFQSPALDSAGRFAFTFRRPGTYHYVCSVHPYMHGVIVVR